MTRSERQEQARVTWVKNGCKGSIVFPTGAGKTRVALISLNKFIEVYPHTRYIVVVPTDNLKVQWQQQLDDWNLGFNGEVIVINTIIKHKYTTDVLIIDECHRVNSDCFRQVFQNVQYKYVLGLTATFERLDAKHQEVMEKYCPVIDRMSLGEALNNGWVSQYKEYEVLLEVDDIDVYEKYNKEFTSHLEFFGFDWNLALSCVGKDGFKARAKLRDDRCGRNATEEQRKEMFKSITYHATRLMSLLQARKKFINNHPKKIEVARKIMEARKGSKIVTFSNNIKMAESIGGGYVYSGRDTKKKARTTIEDFNLMSSGVLHSIRKLDEGADITGLSVAIILGLDSSEIKATQRRGRCIRFEEGKVAEIFNLVIANTVETKWYSNSHKDATYTVINEEGLDDVLNGKEPRPYTKPIKNLTFRF